MIHPTGIQPSRSRMERLARGLTLWQFKRRTKVEESRLSRAERGLCSITKDEANAIAGAFELSLGELFEEQTDGRFMALFPQENKPAA